MNVTLYSEIVIKPVFEFIELFIPKYLTVLPLVILSLFILFILRVICGGFIEDDDVSKEISFDEFAKKRSDDFLAFNIKRENEIKEFYSKYKILGEKND